jgi:O-methyltransferase involved in polyketide biosynthesis
MREIADGEPLAWCSGFWIDLDSEKRTGIVVTTAHLIRTKRPSPDAWLCKDEYASDVKVIIY